MDLYLVITDGDYNWIGQVEKKPDSYWVEYEIGGGYPNGAEGSLHRGSSYLFDMNVFDWRGDWPETSLSSDFSRWYKRVHRDKILNELI